MNQKQREYAIERIRGMRSEAEKAIKAKHTTKAVRMSREDKLALLDTVGLYFETSDMHYTLGKLHHSTDTDEIFNKEAFELEYSAIKKEAASLTDAIMLDSADVTSKLEAFASMVSKVTGE